MMIHRERPFAVVASVLTVGLLSGCLGSTSGHAAPGAKGTTTNTTSVPAGGVTSRSAAPDITSASGSATTASASAGAPATPSTSTSALLTSGASSPPAVTATNTAMAHPPGELAGVPAQCPSADDITLAVHVALPHVYPSDISGALNCTYYADGSTGSLALNVLLAQLPSGTTVDSWKAGTKNANPSAVFVPGVGDAAFYFTAGAAPSSLYFISGGVSCNIYTSNFTSDRAHLAALAESIIEG
jgi:hypothetical protein